MTYSDVKMALDIIPEPIRLVAGAGFMPDSKCIPILISRWRYAGARQGARDMQRVGLAV
jgi:hypothetical protein